MSIQKLIITFIVSSMVLFQSCHDFKKKVDLIIYNANVLTADGFLVNNNCIAVQEGRIMQVGSDAEIRSQYWAEKYIDVKKKFVYPGFIDAHSHFTGYALSLRYADLTQASSFEDVLQILTDFRKTHTSGWLVGRGWDQNKWLKKDFPTNVELNQLFPGVPIVLTRIDGHAVLASDEAIKASGIDLQYPTSEIIRENGNPTGVFLESMADKIRSTIPLPSEKEIEELILTAAQLCFKAGLTAVTDAGINHAEIQRLNNLQHNQKLLLRIDAWLNINEENIIEYVKKDKKIKTNLLRVGALKVYADGALGSRGACLKQPYTDQPDHYGIQVISTEELEKACLLAYKYGYQINTHAIGDSAVSMVLNTYAKFLKPANDRRWRVEHSQVVDPDDINKFGKYHIVPSIQSTHATSDMNWVAARLGNVRIKNAYAYQDLLQQNGWLPNGTDFPIENIDPLQTFYTAVFRKSMHAETTSGFLIENALSRFQALNSITIWAAKASFQEAEYGEIQKGKMASFTILDKDLLSDQESELLNIRVLYTIINGKIVYSSKQ